MPLHIGYLGSKNKMGFFPLHHPIQFKTDQVLMYLKTLLPQHVCSKYPESTSMSCIRNWKTKRKITLSDSCLIPTTLILLSVQLGLLFTLNYFQFFLFHGHWDLLSSRYKYTAYIKPQTPLRHNFQQQCQQQKSKCDNSGGAADVQITNEVDIITVSTVF